MSNLEVENSFRQNSHDKMRREQRGGFLNHYRGWKNTEMVDTHISCFGWQPPMRAGHSNLNGFYFYSHFDRPLLSTLRMWESRYSRSQPASVHERKAKEIRCFSAATRRFRNDSALLAPKNKSCRNLRKSKSAYSIRRHSCVICFHTEDTAALDIVAPCDIASSSSARPTGNLRVNLRTCLLKSQRFTSTLRSRSAMIDSGR
ncbi:hypothetical protein NQ318_020057 [Aromia moschata]|uniref:Uncharacterized protein n=1 Tax=Aromia moschata TaxID=1265417 RepID=A0AAV8ZA07_9CUCU|nr:hypothetical protein NQ318_020057 [Aromia moschata]